jgi:hypothetical protein
VENCYRYSSTPGKETAEPSWNGRVAPPDLIPWHSSFASSTAEEAGRITVSPRIRHTTSVKPTVSHDKPSAFRRQCHAFACHTTGAIQVGDLNAESESIPLPRNESKTTPSQSSRIETIQDPGQRSDVGRHPAVFAFEIDRAVESAADGSSRNGLHQLAGSCQ